VAGLLLALAEDSTMRISESPITLVTDVNGRIEQALSRHNKQDFRAEVSLKLPNTPENHRKYWTAIVQTMQHLREMNIRSAINSGTDALGQFYETFLKHANDAKEMGIVLTPRHITKFAVDVLGIRPDDLIFDPACGTGGFLVAALDLIREKHYGLHQDVYDSFRNDCLFGVEQNDGVFGLALVNMIFRGDGKSRIHNGNCFDNRFVRQGENVVRVKKEEKINNPATAPFTRVLMNPPFAIKEPESAFVDYALDQTAKGGLLFAVLPNEPITGSNSKWSRWRQGIVSRHTVRAVVKLPNDLFYPVAKGTYALILEAWRPHRSNDHVFFGILMDDDHATNKSKLLSPLRSHDNVKLITDDLSRFLVDGRSRIQPVPKQIGVKTLSLEGCWDFAAEAYLDSEALDVSISSQPVEGLFVEMARKSARDSRNAFSTPNETQVFKLEDLFMVRRGKCNISLKNLYSGDTPVVTTSEFYNGISGYYFVEDGLIEQAGRITISANGGGGAAFWHPYRFAANNDVLVCEWLEKRNEYMPSFNLYVCNAISNNKWRFDYYRKSTVGRAIADIKIRIPMRNGMIDYNFIQEDMSRMPGFDQLMGMIRAEN